MARGGGKPFVFVRRHGQMRAYLNRLELDMPAEWTRAVERVADVYIEVLRADSPVDTSGDPRRQPGGIQRGWRRRTQRAGLRPRVVISNTEAYLKYVTGGRGAIDQRTKPPGRRWPLHFWVGGKEMWRWRVGPQAPNPFHIRAIRRARPRAARVLREQVRHIAELRGR